MNTAKALCPTCAVGVALLVHALHPTVVETGVAPADLATLDKEREKCVSVTEQMRRETSQGHKKRSTHHKTANI